MRRLALAFLLQAGQLLGQDVKACADADAAWLKCEQVEKISIASGATECQFRRVFYTCILQEGCYNADAACRDQGNPVSCRELCENEPNLADCVDERDLPPPQDYHLCPHLLKGMVSTPPPTLEDFLAAPALPYTFIVWTSFTNTESADPATLLPALLPPAIAIVLASAMQLNPLAISVQEPISHSKGSLTLPGSLAAPIWTQHTSFLSLNIHIRNVSDIQRMQLEAETLLVTAQTQVGLESLAEALTEELDAAFPATSNLQIARLRLVAREGLTIDFPSIAETTTTAPTTTEESKLQLQTWRAWRIRCLEGIIHRWEVAELEFWDRCEDGQLFSGHAITSASHAEHVEDNAFDGDPGFVRTVWLSACSGCSAGTPWLGLDAASNPFRVACVNVVQGATATNMCGRIAVEASKDLTNWEVQGEMLGLNERQSLCVPRTPEDFPSLQCGSLEDGCGGSIQFGACPGSQEICDRNQCICQGRLEVSDVRFSNWECGDHEDGCGATLRFGSCNSSNATCFNNRCKETAFTAAHWRLVCTGNTVARWVVREVRFHADGLCVIPHTTYRAARSSGSQYSQNPALFAFDGETSTSWISSCHACEPLEAWLSLEFTTDVVVRCVRIYQHSSTSQQCPSLALEYSDDGTVWSRRHDYGSTGLTIGESSQLEADMDAKFVAEEVFVEERFAYVWRITCMQEMRVPWKVREFNFFDNEECSNSLRGAVTDILESAPSTWPPGNAYDQSESTIWRTQCGECDGTSDSCACQPGEAYIGARFLRRVRPRCFSVTQLEENRGLCNKLAIHFSDDTGQVQSWTLRSDLR
ncbi:unnamed protein product [Effrenium voratum]|nr:unnamed protein product [Effrenium voratum]